MLMLKYSVINQAWLNVLGDTITSVNGVYIHTSLEDAKANAKDCGLALRRVNIGVYEYIVPYQD